MNPKIKVEANSAIRAYARLKGVNVYLVLFNAMKDFLNVAYHATPIAKILGKPSEWALFTRNRTTKIKKDRQFVKIQGSSKQIEHLKKYQYKAASRWSMSSWIAAFRAMGMGKESKGVNSWLNRHKKASTLTMENVVKNKTLKKQSSLESISVTDRIWFDKLPGTEQKIIQLGTAKAALNIANDWNREINRKWGL